MIVGLLSYTHDRLAAMIALRAQQARPPEPVELPAEMEAYPDNDAEDVPAPTEEPTPQPLP